MAFNFNWSPLTADADFYSRAQDLLTTALNKSPKPPIIVDDILVNELNLGSVPPELEILEIGDLAEDRFRGIFKMCYTGDAFLTLQTRVQVCWHNLPYLSLNYARLWGIVLYPESCSAFQLVALTSNFPIHARATNPSPPIHVHWPQHTLTCQPNRQIP
jgi:hypothetical protein